MNRDLGPRLSGLVRSPSTFAERAFLEYEAVLGFSFAGDDEMLILRNECADIPILKRRKLKVPVRQGNGFCDHSRLRPPAGRNLGLRGPRGSPYLGVCGLKRMLQTQGPFSGIRESRKSFQPDSFRL